MEAVLIHYVIHFMLSHEDQYNIIVTSGSEGFLQLIDTSNARCTV